MRRGFTLLELIVVIVIIGILATLGFAQYTRMIERSRGAEARSVIGAIRTQAAALWIEAGGMALPAGTITDAAVGVGTNPNQISSNCASAADASKFFFEYGVTQKATNDGFDAVATRCTAGGKNPQGPAATTLTLDTNFASGQDTWGGTGGY